MSYTPPQELMKTAFGELSVAEMTPIVQASAQYNILTSKMRAVSFGAGSSTGATGGEFYSGSGTSAAGFASVFSRRAINYHAGQGLIGRFTMRCDTPEADSVQYGGLINATDGFAFGYLGTNFGIFYNSGGHQEIQSLQVTTSAGGAENATITIDGTGYTVPLTNTTVQGNCLEIADSLNSQVPLWVFQQIDDTVVCRSLVADTFGGAFSFASATAVAAFTQISAGEQESEVFISQNDWNGINPANWEDNNGDSAPLNPVNGNVYEIQTQYLGYGNIFFSIENPYTGLFELVHQINYPNNHQEPLVSQPSFRIGWVSGNRGSTTDKIVTGASVLIGIEGKHELTEQARSLSHIKVGIGSTATNILTIQNREVLGTEVNLAEMIPELITVATDSSKGAIFEIAKSAIVAGEPNFQYVSEEDSIAIYDTAGTTTTNGTNILTVTLGPNGDKTINIKDFNISILPGEKLTISARVTSGASSDMAASFVWQEDL